ncbi:MAG: type II secretion system protein [Patescibacteria group bacterium]|jgi:prepilin-type N-terminal cleavage/methylation domain-containing protein
MKTKKGFTLIELLVVVAIIGLLATLGVIAFRDAQKKARDTKRLGDMRSVVAAFATANNEGTYALCKADCSAAPVAGDLLSASRICNKCGAGGVVDATIINLGNLTDPLSTNVAQGACDGVKTACNYAYTGVAPSLSAYTLSFVTEQTAVPGLGAGAIHSTNQNGIVN